MAGLMTYSFLDIHAALVGPGASISLGAGAGASEEGITIEPQGDVNTMAIGADGTPMHSLHANKGGHITCRFLKTSPVNRLLAQALAFQRTSASNHGQNTLTVVSAVSGDSITCQAVAFAKTPTVEYGVDGKMLEWRFDAGIIDVVLGGGFA
jgi:hypothetical protein